ncbi:MAG TPA: hypothetical protein PKD86_09085, partial [Gemmatales bacterium]|nr:hypothetical protein [Gemmatales bacterium]
CVTKKRWVKCEPVCQPCCQPCCEPCDPCAPRRCRLLDRLFSRRLCCDNPCNACSGCPGCGAVKSEPAAAPMPTPEKE